MTHDGQIHLALTSAYPTEPDALRALMTMPDSARYLGAWLAPTFENIDERPEVHVFVDGDADADDLQRMGWVRA